MNRKQLVDNLSQDFKREEETASPVRPSAMKLLDQMESKDNLNYDSDVQMQD